MAEDWCPGAIRKEIRKFSRPLTVQDRGVVGHIAVSEAASLYGYFSGAQVCSTWYIRRSTPEQLAAGGMADFEQYVPCSRIAPANYQGNSTLFSWESQGGLGADANSGLWDAGQLRRAAYILVWLHQTRGIPLEVMSSSLRSQRGQGYHRLGIDPWRVSGGERWSTSRGKVCPGNARVNQVAEITNLARAMVGSGPIVGPVTPVGNGGSVKNWLEQGDTGAAVTELQTLLRGAGWALDADGVFGPLTDKAVRQYQGSRGLVVDGLAGSATLSALRAGTAAIAAAVDPTLQQGARGPAVGKVQRFLGITADDIFGPQTQAAVIAYQRGVGLTADGVVGPLTWAKVNGGIRPSAPTAPARAVLQRGLPRHRGGGPAVASPDELPGLRQPPRRRRVLRPGHRGRRQGVPAPQRPGTGRGCRAADPRRARPLTHACQVGRPVGGRGRAPRARGHLARDDRSRLPRARACARHRPRPDLDRSLTTVNPAPPETITGLTWLLGIALIVGIPALSTMAVALMQRPVRRDARAAVEQATAAAESSRRAAMSAGHAATELTWNHGSSTKDQTERIEASLTELVQSVAQVQTTSEATARDIGGLREEIRTERRERLNLSERLDTHITNH